jgi:hypothetical protein
MSMDLRASFLKEETLQYSTHSGVWEATADRDGFKLVMGMLFSMAKHSHMSSSFSLMEVDSRS